MGPYVLLGPRGRRRGADKREVPSAVSDFGVKVATFLERFGLARRTHSVEAGTRLHVTAAVVDASTGGPLSGVSAILEVVPPGPPRHRAKAATTERFRISDTDSSGRLDAVV